MVETGTEASAMSGNNELITLETVTLRGGRANTMWRHRFLPFLASKTVPEVSGQTT
jgi:hypothetical protein